MLLVTSTPTVISLTPMQKNSTGETLSVAVVESEILRYILPVKLTASVAVVVSLTTGKTFGSRTVTTSFPVVESPTEML